MSMIEIREFPGWKCSSCGHTGTSRSSYPHKCPGCGETRTVSLFNGPKRRHPWFDHRTGHYGYSLSDGSYTDDWCVTFYNLEEGKSRSFTVDVEYEFDTDDMTVLDVAEQLASIIGRYIYSKQKEEIPVVVKWLHNHKDEHERMEAEYQVELCQWNLWNASLALRDAESELECLLEDSTAE